MTDLTATVAELRGKPGPSPRPLHDRFREKVQSAGADECWGWSGRHDRNGYGTIFDSTHRRHVFAHRVALVIDGRPPGALLGLHTCDNKGCVNPAHLYVGTKRDNILDAFERGQCNMRGAANPRAKLTRSDVVEMRRRHATGETASDLATGYRLSLSHTRNILDGTRWSHVALLAKGGTDAD